MYFGDIVSVENLQQYGLLALVPIFLGVIAFLYIQGGKSQKKFEDSQNARIDEGRETEKRITDLANKLNAQQESMRETFTAQYDTFISLSKRGE